MSRDSGEDEHPSVSDTADLITHSFHPVDIPQHDAN